MSLATRLADVVTAIGTDVKALLARPTFIELGPTDPVPGGTPSGTLIIRRRV